MYAKNQKEFTTDDLGVMYTMIRNYSEELCKPLEIEDYVPQPIQDVSPPKWNIAHTNWFFEEMILKRFVREYKEFSPDFKFLFNSYYNTFGERTLRHKRGDLSRPTVKEIFDYRKYVDEQMAKFLQQNLSKKKRDAVILGLNHEQQHQELFLTDLKYIFSVNPTFPVYMKDFALVEKGEIESNGFTEVEGGVYEIGFEGDGFHFDNELGRHKTYVDDFQIQQNLVTNEEFIEFINDGGYRDHRLWHSEGWDWVSQHKINSPLYWLRKDGEWFNFTLAGLRKVKLKKLVSHISFYEASAFAEWRGLRLPTEFEWEIACDKFNWGVRWEWTSSAYLPYPNFRAEEGAIGEYNGKFMVNQKVLRGSSVATPANHSRKTYRNFFHPHLSWQFTGIRLAKS